VLFWIVHIPSLCRTVKRPLENSIENCDFWGFFASEKNGKGPTPKKDLDVKLAPMRQISTAIALTIVAAFLGLGVE